MSLVSPRADASARSDVVVVGGGPAGLAAAIAARLTGLNVVVVDTARPPIDKACGEGILPAGVEALRRLGIPVSGEDGFCFRGIRFFGNGFSVAASFRSGFGWAMRRTRLHEILIRRASALGVRMIWGRRVTDLAELSSCRWVVGADGMNSWVRRAAGLDDARPPSLRFGYRRHYRIAPWSDFVEIHWGSLCQIYVTPVSLDEIGIALLSRDPHLRLDCALKEFPDLQNRLRGGVASSAERGAVTSSRRLRRVFRGRTALIGDASGSVDAITGEGLSLSFRQSVALAEALCRGDLQSYQAEHRRMARRPASLARFLLSLDSLPVLRRCCFGMVSFEPSLLAAFLAA